MKESQQTEWKQTWRDEYLRWICGFANAQGGTLCIGKNDNGEVVCPENYPENPRGYAGIAKRWPLRDRGTAGEHQRKRSEISPQQAQDRRRHPPHRSGQRRPLGGAAMKQSPPGTAEPQLRIDAPNTQDAPNKEALAQENAERGAVVKAELGLRGPREETGVRWYSRGYLPHYDDIQKFQAVTFRLADSLPAQTLAGLEAELERHPPSKRDAQRRKSLDQWLNNGSGCCALRHPQVAKVMQETLLKFDGARYRLIAWCIMPNHVHTLIQAETNLARLVQSWKSFTGRWALARNLELQLGIPSHRFWMPDYWDRYIRDPEHFSKVVDYIHQNPVAADLCQKAEDWLWSSARLAPETPEPQLRIDPPDSQDALNWEALARENTRREGNVQAEVGLRGPREKPQ